MTDLIRSQAGIIVIMTYCGLTSYLVYDFFTLFINRFIKKNKAARVSARLFGYIIIGILAADFSMYCQNGKLSFTGLVCFAAGLLLWRRFFYGIISGKNSAEDCGG